MERGIVIRIGHGYDVHRLTAGRKLILGGVEIPYEKGLLGHSDADVLTHAVMDALLGAACLGDIGRCFPDTDPAYEGADSLLLLDRVMEMLRSRRLGRWLCKSKSHYRGKIGVYGLRRGNCGPRSLPAVQRTGLKCGNISCLKMLRSGI